MLAGFPAEKYTLPPRSLVFGSLSKKNFEVWVGLAELVELRWAWLDWGELGWDGVSWAGVSWGGFSWYVWAGKS